MRNLVIIFLSLIGLFIGGCGLFFSGAAVYDWSIFSGSILIFSLPSMVAGTLIGWFGWRKYKRASKPDGTTSDGLDQ